MTPINEVVFIVCRIDAYKHIKVRDIDIPLQCISFLGKIFTEGSVTFGASSSLSIFRWISEIILVLAVIISMIRKKQTLKQLDDVVMFRRQ